jgi:hypothetical protein
MREQGVYARCERGHVHTAWQDPTYQKAANILSQDVQAVAPNQKWVTDVTAI